MAKAAYEDIITGLDIGSTHVRVAVGARTPADKSRSGIQIVGVAETPSFGVQKALSPRSRTPSPRFRPVWRKSSA